MEFNSAFKGLMSTILYYDLLHTLDCDSVSSEVKVKVAEGCRNM